MTIAYQKQALPFQYPFSISGGRTKTHQDLLCVSITLDGETGYGEAPAIDYYDVTVEGMIAILERHKREIEAFHFRYPGSFHRFLQERLPGHPFLICALDMAAWDLYGKKQNALLYELWGCTCKNLPLTDYTIGIDTTAEMVRKMQAKPWPVYKIKVGNPGDVETLRVLRQYTNSPFRVDANGGWTVREALEKIPLLQELQVELIEQPIDKNNWEGMKVLMEHSPIPLFADESCVGEADVERCAGYFHGINIKLTKCGGITPALRMIKKARRLNLAVMMGTMNESSIGTAAIAHFLPQLNYVDADGPLLLSEDLATGLSYNQGMMHIGGKAGLGIELVA